jgi:hypothetical protein
MWGCVDCGGTGSGEGPAAWITAVFTAAAPQWPCSSSFARVTTALDHFGTGSRLGRVPLAEISAMIAARRGSGLASSSSTASDNIVRSLRERGVPVEYIVAEDEGHGFENPENQFRLYRAIERHFAEHLGGRRDTSAPG